MHAGSLAVRRLSPLGGVIALAGVVSPASASVAVVAPVRCHDMQGESWDYYATYNGQSYVQQTGTAYLTFASGVSCDFARRWAQKMSLGNKNIKHGVFTNGPSGWKCKRQFSDVFKEEAMHQPLAGFDIGPSNCGRFVGKRRHRRGLGFSWGPLPLSIQPY